MYDSTEINLAPFEIKLLPIEIQFDPLSTLFDTEEFVCSSIYRNKVHSKIY